MNNCVALKSEASVVELPSGGASSVATLVSQEVRPIVGHVLVSSS